MCILCSLLSNERCRPICFIPGHLKILLRLNFSPDDHMILKCILIRSLYHLFSLWEGFYFFVKFLEYFVFSR